MYWSTFILSLFLLVPNSVSALSCGVGYQDLFLFCEDSICSQGIQEIKTAKTIGTSACRVRIADVAEYNTNTLNQFLESNSVSVESGTYQIALAGGCERRVEVVGSVLGDVPSQEPETAVCLQSATIEKVAENNVLVEQKERIFTERQQQIMRDVRVNVLLFLFWFLIGLLPSLVLMFFSKDKTFFSKKSVLMNTVMAALALMYTILTFSPTSIYLVVALATLSVAGAVLKK